MLGKWLSPMHPHYPSPALYLLLCSLSLGGGGPAPATGEPCPAQCLSQNLIRPCQANRGQDQ